LGSCTVCEEVSMPLNHDLDEVYVAMPVDREQLLQIYEAKITASGLLVTNFQSIDPGPCSCIMLASCQIGPHLLVVLKFDQPFLSPHIFAYHGLLTWLLNGSYESTPSCPLWSRYLARAPVCLITTAGRDKDRTSHI